VVTIAALKDWVTAVFVIAGIMLRLLEEEKFLKADLAGYEECCKKTGFRLIPGVW